MNPTEALAHDRMRRLVVFSAWLAIMLLCVAAYWPGLHGPFVFDDFGSLAALGELGGVRDWETFKAYVFGGFAGPTGRPLALLSFLIDARDWPADTFGFKRTNLIIHLANGALLGMLMNQILKVLAFDMHRRRWIALLATACWLLHPFLVSTTLYAVQRMAQLATLFTFLGLSLYLYGRSQLASAPKKAYVIMSASIAVFTLLAMISKENGLLLPLSVGVFEATIFASRREQLPTLNRNWFRLFVLLPAFVVAAYLVTRMARPDFLEVIPPRDFSILERFLTQARILADYLRHLLIPELYTSGVFQDYFAKSTSLLNPITTLAGFVLHGVLIGVAIKQRRAWPLFSLALLFFYVNHLVESTVINLELYFEHRNYLPAAFLFLPLVAVLNRRSSAQLFAVIGIAVTLLLAGFTRYSATIWQDYPSMVVAAAQKAPRSARAQMQYAVNLFNDRRYEESIDVIDRSIQTLPENTTLPVVRATILCNIGAMTPAEFGQFSQRLTQTSYDARSLAAYESLANAVIEGHCAPISPANLADAFEGMLQLARNADETSMQYSQIQYLTGLAYAHSGDADNAMRAFRASLDARPGPSHTMAMAAILATTQHYDAALALADEALAVLERDATQGFGANQVSADDVRAFRQGVLEEISSSTDRIRQDADSADPAP